MVWWGFKIWTNLDETLSNKTIRENSWLLNPTQKKKIGKNIWYWHVDGRNGWDVSSSYSYTLLWMFLRQLLVECGLMYVDPPHVLSFNPSCVEADFLSEGPSWIHWTRSIAPHIGSHGVDVGLIWGWVKTVLYIVYQCLKVDWHYHPVFRHIWWYNILIADDADVYQMTRSLAFGQTLWGC